MTRLLPVSGRKMCKILEKIGFERILDGVLGVASGMVGDVVRYQRA